MRKKKTPKPKTHSGAKKRYKVTGTGKLMRERAGLRHNLEVKSSRRKRRLSGEEPLAAGDIKMAKRLLGI